MFASASTVRHAKRVFLPSALRRVATASPICGRAQPNLRRGLATRVQPGREKTNATGATAAAAVAAAAAVGVMGFSLRPEDRSPVAAVEAYAIPIGRAFPSICNCFIEVSRESRMKYEWDEETNMLKLDRVLHGAAFYPHDYGFIPQTLCGDGDPLDVLVLGTSALQPGAIVDIRPLGYMVMEDEKGLDEKVLAVPDKDPRFNHMNSLRDVPEHVLREITNFFETYKQLEKAKWVKVGGWKGTTDTHELIERTHKSYVASKTTVAARTFPEQATIAKR